MPRSIRSRPGCGSNVRLSLPSNRRKRSAPGRCRYDSIRLIGAPIGVTLPRLKGIRPRYCSERDEGPAATLALSMLRLSIARMTDWNGSSVDFVAKALSRFCRSHGLATVSRVFSESSIRLLDEVLERNDYERSVSSDAEPSSRMFLMVDYYSAAVVQIGPTLSLLGLVDEVLPAAFFQVFATNLWRWMRVYDFRDAEQYAEDETNIMDEEELKESYLPQVKGARPDFLNDLPEYELAVKRLEEALAQGHNLKVAGLIRKCLELHKCGDGHETKWPSFLRDEVLEMEDYLENTDYPGPGALIVFQEDDPVEACFSEEMRDVGTNYAIRSTLMLLIKLDQEASAVDQSVDEAFAYLGAMLRSLECATVLIEAIRGIYDEHLRQRRLESGIQAAQSTAGIRSDRP